MVGAILQARMSSARLPGKVLFRFPWNGGVTLIERIVGQVSVSKHVEKLVVATSTDASDDPIASLCRDSGISCFRGSLENVYHRFVEANALHRFDHIVRLTGDNPLVDAGRLDMVIEGHLNSESDYSYTDHLPLGCNFEVCNAESLRGLGRFQMSKDELEHVTLHFKLHPGLHRLNRVDLPLPDLLKGISGIRLTVDYPSDYAFWNLLAGIDRQLESLEAVARINEKFPWIKEINKNNTQLVFI
jgi:spore coat polysaccharide biosynthesis protein SpsF